MNPILEKRSSLETFIREQTIGPGISGYRYVKISNEKLVNSTCLSPSKYHNEVINVMPATVYSTGILFPKDESSSAEIGVALENNEQTQEANDTQDDSLDSIEETDTIEIDQMFPKMMGMTFCLDETFLDSGVLEFDIQARRYTKISRAKNKSFNEEYAVSVEVDIDYLRSFLIQYEIDCFNISILSGRHFLTLNKINAERIRQVREQLREADRQKAQETFEGQLGELLKKKSSNKLYNISSLLKTIFFELKYNVVDDELREVFYNISQELELFESVSNHLRDVLDINSTKEVWESDQIQRRVRIQGITFPETLRKKSYTFNSPLPGKEKVTIEGPGGIVEGSLKEIYRYNLNENEYAALSVNLQLSRDTRKSTRKIFAKIQLINDSSGFISDNDQTTYYSVATEKVNNKSFFGVSIQLKNEHLKPYNELSYRPDQGVYGEDDTTKFVYRFYKDYGIGHGCSVSWSPDEGIIRTEYIPSCETPDIEPVPRDKSKEPISPEGVSYFETAPFSEVSSYQEFKWLSEFSQIKNQDVVLGLLKFVDQYGEWIENKRGKYYSTDLEKEIATQELDKCESDYKRMRGNILKHLDGKENKGNIQSFRLMNSAMFMQLYHSQKVKDKSINDLIEDSSFETFDLQFYQDQATDLLFPPYKHPAAWRAFQLAFILLNLDGVFQVKEDSKWEMRNNWVDLVWFPTGGGKTEAYLGLIALTIINRRKLHGAKGGGTAAIMRYTLRLLTMQQFQRATLVIMALELIRRWNIYSLGEEPITIGLWVGNDSLPNQLIHQADDTKKDSLLNEFQKLNDNKENKIPLDNCPWCGSKLIGEISLDRGTVFNQNKLHLKCSNTNKCTFSFGKGRPSARRLYHGEIPVALSDKTIYEHPPSLLFGTVDKFAQLAHKVDDTNNQRNNDSRRIFGRGNWGNGKPPEGYLPPDLIIQDELHLLLGPLGSAVALFESAVDELCTREDGTRPKVISSTATTRNTNLQIAAIFDRKVNLFPKPGVECDDSFFAFYKRRFANDRMEGEQYISKRKYLGFLPTGRTQIWMQMRLAAIVLTHRAVTELDKLGDKSPIDFDHYKEFKKVIDYYYTIISYFNSLKEVGKTQSQIQTYILKEVRRVFSRVVRPQKLMHSFYTYGPLKEAELTGRLSGEEVKNELKEVERKWEAANRFAQKSETKTRLMPSEFVVATNMISVGIDVSRFNTIIMNSMPRNTAEYIQASSRVARDAEGLVLTVHHPFRARDISHYEKYIEFHEKMYSYVEPISITPFTKKAIDRYLGLYLATILRHKYSEFTNRDGAVAITSITPSRRDSIIQEITENFSNRQQGMVRFGKSVENLLTIEDLKYLKRWINEAINEWETFARGLPSNTDLVFNNKPLRSTTNVEQLYVSIEEYSSNIHSKKWQVPMSLRVIEPEAAINIHSK